MMTSQPKAPDGGWGWVIAACSFVNHVFLLGSATSFSVLYVSWLGEFGMAKSATSWIISTCTAVMFMSGPVCSAVATRIGYRLTTVTGGVLACLGLFLSSFATSVTHLLISIGLITGFGYGLAYLSSLANVVIYFDERRALATCIGTSGAGVGSFVMAPLLNALTEAYGWRGAVLITGALVSHICVTGMLMRPLAPATNNNSNFEADEESPKKSVEGGRQESCRLKGELDLDLERRIKVENPSGKEKEEAEFCLKWERGDLVRMENASDDDDGRSLQGGDGQFPLYKDNREAAQNRPRESDALHSDYIAQPPVVSERDNPDDPMLCKPMDFNEHREGGAIAIRSDIEPTRSEKSKNSELSPSLNTNTTISSSPRSRSTRLISCDSSKCKLYDNSNNTQCCCLSCSMRRLKRNVKSIIRRNKEVVKEPAFAFLATSQILICMSSIAPLVFIVDRAIHNDIAKSSAVWLISIYGIGSVSGRLFFGVLADKHMTKHLMTYIVILNLSGIATALSPLCGGSFVLNGMYAGIFGFCMGGVASLVIIVIVDVMGLTKVAVTLGLLLFSAGLGHVVGPPIGGFVYDLTDSYTLSYVCQGIFLTISGGVLLPVCCNLRRKAETVCD